MATAIPMISKIMPIRMIANRIKKAVMMLLWLITSSETNEMAPEMTIVTKKMVTTQRTALFRAFLDDAGSAFDT